MRITMPWCDHARVVASAYIRIRNNVGIMHTHTHPHSATGRMLVGIELGATRLKIKENHFSSLQREIVISLIAAEEKCSRVKRRWGKNSDPVSVVGACWCLRFVSANRFPWWRSVRKPEPKKSSPILLVFVVFQGNEHFYSTLETTFGHIISANAVVVCVSVYLCIYDFYHYK